MDREGCSEGHRGVSPVVGVALLIGMVVTGALLVFVLGGNLLTQIETQAQIEDAEQSFRESAARLDGLRDSAERTEFVLPSDGDVDLVHETSIELTANRNRSCTTGPVDVGTVRYEHESGDRIGYELGGVWRSHADGGSSMVSEPGIEYRDGRLTLSLSDFDGSLGNTEAVTASLDQSNSQNFSRHLMEAMVSNQTYHQLGDDSHTGPAVPTCGQRGVNNVTVHVNGSQFASAWQTYASRNFDDEAVTVHQSDVSSGDDVSIEFDLGLNLDPTFRVTDVDAPLAHSAGDDLHVNATVENTGNVIGSQDANLSWTGETTGRTDSQRGNPVTIASNESRELEFVVDDSALDTPPTEPVTNYTLNVTTDDDFERFNVTVGNGPAPEFSVGNLDLSDDDPAVGDDVTLTANVTNVGGFEATKPVTFDFDGSEVASKAVEIDDGDTESVDFDVPTSTSAQNISINVSSPDDHNTTTIDIGNAPYFQLVDTNAPSSVQTNDPFDVEAIIENPATENGVQNVEAVIRNATDGSRVESTDQDLAVTSGSTKSLNLSFAGISERGYYNYTVATANTTATGTLYVGETPDDNFVVTSVEPSSTFLEPGEELAVNATVRNVGSDVGSNQVTYELDGSVQTDTVQIYPGIEQAVGAPGTFSAPSDTGTYNVTVQSDGSDLRVPITVYDPDARNFDYNETIVAEDDIRVRLRLLGTELTGYSTSNDPNRVRRTPIEMALYTNNESQGEQYIYPWGQGTDVNSPSFWRKQVDDDPELNVTTEVGNGTEISVFAESFSCDSGSWQYEPGRGFYWENGWKDSGYTRIVDGQTAESYYCDRREGSWIPINQHENPSNLVILEDGDELPYLGEGNPDQRDVDEILGEDYLVERPDARPVLNVSDNQLVLLYELSERDAHYSEANTTGEDPDYNDAVVLFEQVQTLRNRTVLGESRFEITDVDVPTQVDNGDNVEMDVTVENTGARANATAVEFSMNGGHVETESTPHLEPDESHTLSMEVPTTPGTIPGSVSLADTFPLTVELSASPDRVRRNIHVGDTSNSYLVPNVEAYPTAVEPGTAIELETTITNVGDQASGPQDVEVTQVGGTGAVSAGSDDVTVSLGGGNETTHNFSVSTTADTGRVDLAIDTGDATQTVEVVVDTPDFQVDEAFVGPESYGDDETILTTGLDKMDVLVDNDAVVSDSQSVELHVESDHDNSVDETVRPEDATNDPLSLAPGQSSVVTYDLPDEVATDVGTYTFEVTTDDDTFEGTIEVVESTDGTPAAPTGDLVSIDGNVIVLGS